MTNQKAVALRRKAANRGEPKEQELLSSLLAEWCEVEAALLHLYLQLCNAGGNIETYAAIYRSLPSLTMRLHVIDGLLRHAETSGAALKAWSSHRRAVRQQARAARLSESREATRLIALRQQIASLAQGIRGFAGARVTPAPLRLVVGT